MAIVEFQQAFADMIGSPAYCNAVRTQPLVLDERYELTPRERSRLLAIVNHPGMVCNCMLYRANRLAPLAVNLPQLLEALGSQLRGTLDRFWDCYVRTDVHFYVEAHRFCEFVQREIGDGRVLNGDVIEPVLWRELAVLEPRLEASHTELYSPLRRAESASAWGRTG